MTNNYNLLRRETLQNCREYRRRYKQAARLSGWASKDTRPNWLESAADWYRRLHNEQYLLLALRQRGPVGYRQQVIENWSEKETTNA